MPWEDFDLAPIGILAQLPQLTQLQIQHYHGANLAFLPQVYICCFKQLVYLTGLKSLSFDSLPSGATHQSAWPVVPCPSSV